MHEDNVKVGNGVQDGTTLGQSTQRKDDVLPERKYTNEDLKTMQAWDLERKIQVTQTRLIEWYTKWGGKCYVSFSGGKDSTVLAYLAAQVCVALGYKLVLWFSDTGMEFPEIHQHVKAFPDYLRSKFQDLEVELMITHPTYSRVDNVTGKKKGDRITYRDVIKKYGYPVISKEIAKAVGAARNCPNGRTAQLFVPGSEATKKYDGRYSRVRYAYLLDAPFAISDQCCYRMKKSPAESFESRSGSKPIVGTMANESLLRQTKWLKDGCNAYDSKRPTSKPLSFWLEQDILAFIVKYSVPLATIYGEIESDDGGRLHTTGYNRTGCFACCFGTQREKEPNRFQRLKQTHPGLWEYCMKPYDEGGLGMKEVLEYIGVKTGAEDEAGDEDN